MITPPARVFLDTNVFIIGAAQGDSVEATILQWLGFNDERDSAVEIVVSDALFKQIVRVARRLRNKDWGGELLARIWQHLNVHYVILDVEAVERLEQSGVIPREDVLVYLTAREGQVDCFVSANRKLIAALAQQTGAFECLTPEAFVAKYIKVS